MCFTDKKYKIEIEKDRLALGRKPMNSIKKIRNIFVPDYIWNYQVLLRKAEFLSEHKDFLNKLFLFYYKMKFRRASVKLGFSIPPGVFAEGLSIAHYGTIVVNGATRGGKNCRLHVGVNIGASNGSDKAPHIGDNVYIGPGAIIYGDIEIANNVTIAANSTVNKSCLVENVVLAGSPAKIVKENFPVWWEAQKLKL